MPSVSTGTVRESGIEINGLLYARTPGGAAGGDTDFGQVFEQ